MIVSSSLLLGLLGGMLIGAALVLLFLRPQQSRDVELVAERLKNEMHQANARIAESQRDQFLALASERFSAAEERANAKLSEVVAPVQQKLVEFDGLVKDIEKQRIGAYEGLKEQIVGLIERGGKLEVAANQLTAQTSVLVTALRNPTTRGKWGEVQLRRVVEAAGMLRHVDFHEQVHSAGSETTVRPDLV
ncbi:MAG: DNA recombination protein RmuC, partial [Candidatus Eremiobacteraeota bacterium]|nr:DNA recombination protein RmuC [Candidatus Eremiobacteraeota bacterium]